MSSVKRPHPGGDETNKNRKKQKTADARTIHFQSGPSTGTGVVTNSMSGLPGAIDVEKFAEARSFEIAAMQSAMETAQNNSTHRVWQTLPRSLRRRAASHDARRVPVRLREKAIAEMDSKNKKKGKKKSGEKGKSKAITRTASFLNRQRDKKWLETHIWHSKRMHMKNVWGYRLAETPTDKSFRPSYRASLHSSILHDASYIGTISISGKQSILDKILSRCCDCQGAGPSALRYTLGSRIQETHIYKLGAYPFGLVAPVTILWKPLNLTLNENTVSHSESTEKKKGGKSRKKGKEKEVVKTVPLVAKPDVMSRRTVWVRVHPSAWDEVWSTLQEAASLALKDFQEEHHATQSSNGAVDENHIPEESVEMLDLRSQLNCFELTGPKTSQVLRGVFRPINAEDRPEFNEFWTQLKDLQSSGGVPRGMIIGFKVYDPRLEFPPKNAKVDYKTDGGKPSTNHSAMFTVFPNANLAKTELWDEAEREEGCRKPRFRKDDIDNRRNKNMTPGTRLVPLRQDDRIPVMLIQRTVGQPSSPTDRISEHRNMHGWSLLFPAHWGMTFLSSLVYTGTRVGGLMERRTQSFEAGTVDFPFDYPLTKSYEVEQALSEAYEKGNWERKPPAKRVTWDAVGTRSPFRADWEVVLGLPAREKGVEDFLDTQRVHEDEELMATEKSEHSDDETTLWLLRGPDAPAIIQTISTSSTPTTLLLQKMNELRAKRHQPPLTINAKTLFDHALLQVHLKICGRGAPDDLAAIYSVKEEEASSIRRLLLEKKEGDLNGDADEQLSKTSFNDSEIIGYVTTGNFSLSQGRGFASGAVSVAQVVRLLQIESRHNISAYPRLVKVKERESTICRAATLEFSTR